MRFTLLLVAAILVEPTLPLVDLPQREDMDVCAFDDVTTVRPCFPGSPWATCGGYPVDPGETEDYRLYGCAIEGGPICVERCP